MTTWQDSDGTTANANPVILDSVGAAVIWGNTTYRQVVHDASDNLIWDEVVAGSPTYAELAAEDGSSLVGFIQEGANPVARTALEKMRDIGSTLDFGAPSSVGDDGPRIIAAMATRGRAIIPGSPSYAARMLYIQGVTQLRGLVLDGSGWGSGLASGALNLATAAARILLSSFTVLNDVYVNQNGTVGNGRGAVAATLVSGSPISRYSLYRCQVENAGGAGFYYNIAQNGTSIGCFAKGSGTYGYHLQGPENCAFIHSSSVQPTAVDINNPTDAEKARRGIYIETGSNGTTIARNILFLAGIYEGGGCDYQVEIATAISSVRFLYTEINSGQLAKVKNSKSTGLLILDHVAFTTSADTPAVRTALLVDGEDGPIYRHEGPISFSGTFGRVPSSLFSGPCRFDNAPWRPWIEDDFSYALGTFSRYGSSAGTSCNYDAATRSMYVSSASGTEGAQSTPYVGGFEPKVGMAGRICRLRTFCLATSGSMAFVGLTATGTIALTASTNIVVGFNEFFFTLDPALLGFRLRADTAIAPSVTSSVNLKYIIVEWM